ncbi:hypothetical protein ZHAS_00008347 [Anopheles sinensis]|uniref:Odorant receptor n=1 Tax=Anopheles sinensis TaxID=74873 RepID=A0A084VS80_ANOSI|nr:hypothetical protein ZHAS_00008347 [Anopheles sinensis]
MTSLNSEAKFQRLKSLISRHMEYNGVNIIREDWRVSFRTFVCATFVLMQPFVNISSFLYYSHSLDMLTENLSLGCSGIQLVVRTYFYLCQRDLCRNVIREIGEQRLLLGLPDNERMEQLFCKSFDWMARYYWIMHASYLSAITFIAMALVIPDPKKHGLPLAYRLPLLPPDEQDLYWYITFAYHVGLILMAIHYLVPIDGMMMVSLFSARTRVHALKVLLEELDEKIGLSEWQRTEHLEANLNRIIELHVSIRRFTRLINNSYQLHYFTVFGTICFVLCLSVNLIVVTPKNSIYNYLLASICQLFVGCYFGNLLLIENDSLSSCVYCIRWYRMTIAQQKKILILITNTQPDLQVSALFLPVNMASFVTIIRAAYSFFTVIH